MSNEMKIQEMKKKLEIRLRDNNKHFRSFWVKV